MARIVVVEDDEPIADLIVDHLLRAGHKVHLAHDGAKGLALAIEAAPALVILDLMLPELTGWEVCRQLRAREGPQPIVLMLTARASEEDAVLGYETGADDYVKKPFGVRELLARIEALLSLARRTADSSARPSTLSHGSLELDLTGRQAKVKGEDIRLTAMELDMLAYLAARPREVISREELLREVWGYSHAGYLRTVDSHVTRVRRKLARAGVRAECLRTAHGVGYAFEPESA